MKIGTIAISGPRRDPRQPELAGAGVLAVHHGGGPVIPGPLFPFVFITIACGAMSGFHSLISTGTTSKMVDKESDIRPIGYAGNAVRRARRRDGADRCLRALPWRLLRHQHAPAVFANLHIPIVNLPDLQPQVGETSSAAPAAPCRSRSAWRRSSAASRACAG